MTWQEQYIEELKKEIDRHRKEWLDCDQLLCRVRKNDPEAIKIVDEMGLLKTTESTSPEIEYNVGDVLMHSYSLNVARIIEKTNEWYVFDRGGMCMSENHRTHIHKNNVIYGSMRKVDIDLPANIEEEKQES